MIMEAIGECKVTPFGSFVTGLYLPDADVDLTIIVDTNDERKVY